MNIRSAGNFLMHRMTKRERILGTMLEMVAKNGIQATPMSLIAKSAEVATGTIYHHFKSKEEILNAAYLEKKKDFQEIIEKSLKGETSVELRFKSMWMGIYEYYIQQPLVFRFTQQTSSTPIITKESREKGFSYYQGALDFFREGIDAGIFIEMNVVLMAELIHGNICTLVEMELNEEIEASAEILAGAIKFSWRAILKA